MPEETPPVSSGAPNDPQPPQGTPPTPPEPGEGTEVNNPTAKKYADEAAAERKARKALEAKLAEYEKRDKEAELAKLGDLEKAQKQLADLTAQAEKYRKAAAVSELKVAAKDAGAISVNAVTAMLASQIEYGDDGQPTNVPELVKALAKDEPQLFKAEAPRPPVSSGGASNPGRGGPVGRPTRADVLTPGRISLQQSTELWRTGEMQKILNGN